MQQQGREPANKLLQEDVLAIPLAGFVEVPEEADGRRTELHLFLGRGGGRQVSPYGALPRAAHPSTPGPGPERAVVTRLAGPGEEGAGARPAWPGAGLAGPTLSKKGRMRMATCSSTERRSQASTRSSSLARPTIASRATRLCGSSPSSSPPIMAVRSWGPWARTWGRHTHLCARVMLWNGPAPHPPGAISTPMPTARTASTWVSSLAAALPSLSRGQGPRGLASPSPYLGSPRQRWPGPGAPVSAHGHTCPSAAPAGCPAGAPGASGRLPCCCQAAGGRGALTAPPPPHRCTGQPSQSRVTLRRGRGEGQLRPVCQAWAPGLPGAPDPAPPWPLLPRPGAGFPGGGPSLPVGEGPLLSLFVIRSTWLLPRPGRLWS